MLFFGLVSQLFRLGLLWLPSTPLGEGKGAKQGEARLKLSATVWENLIMFMDKNTLDFRIS